ncbi:hypothetical protein VOLCADRAFT_84089 [Volvox carteri f. nagariensis]|uniref:Uncharacterized protein n=1 Tax=Volvox carteri f. nagariensis TaxID=3068 RepID=D8UFI2_VOLCA|nr:uncharacterized protein VOLCADRAFT_84089 [Volvox carteri f. nagariensis]EFJ41507.1 hypothetical protein VOLCADRAFT_84089 [Volvox carteri f. nagariensis]|eukprot:XP_002957452.1 hypothetical protein VOLCADRAFT_84089 [Volvox carteri f. nagariensis]
MFPSGGGSGGGTNPWGKNLSLRRKPAVLAIRLSRELQRRPLLAKCVPTAVGFAFGDCLTQFMNRDRSRTLREQWSFSRTGSMLCIGALCAGPILLSFNRWMDLAVMPSAGSSPVAVAVKFLLDQVVGCFIWQAAYLSINPSYRQSAIALLESSSMQIEEHRRGLQRHAQHALA